MARGLSCVMTVGRTRQVGAATVHRLAIAVLVLAFASAPGFAQVNPTADFDVAWMALPVSGQPGYVRFSANTSSRRSAVSTLDFSIELVRIQVSGNVASSAQSGIVNIPAGGTASAGGVVVNLAPGDSVQAQIVLRHVQEGWELRDTLRRRYGTAPEPAAAPRLAVDPNVLEIDGLVADETLTKSGQDFYGLFYQEWNPPLGARGYSVTVSEAPFRGRQTLVNVSLDEQLLYQRILQTRYDALEEMAEQAAAIVYGALLQRVQAEQSRDGQAGEYLERF